MNRIGLLSFAAAGLFTLAAGCGDDGGSDDSQGSSQGIEIAGNWTSDYGDETIADDSWNGSPIVAFDNAQNVAITQNPADAEYNPSLYNRIIWTEPAANAFFYCFVDFGLDSVEAAEASTATADDSDPATGGCGTFPWTKLARQ